ncbi:hypothetical protein BDW60DRAFT_187847 [Aspergillus nidulans var. acristatus]
MKSQASWILVIEGSPRRCLPSSGLVGCALAIQVHPAASSACHSFPDMFHYASLSRFKYLIPSIDVSGDRIFMLKTGAVSSNILTKVR